MKPRILIIIPAYNESENIGRVIDDIREHLPDTELIVVNDCSSDDTEAAVIRAGEKVLSLPFNLGIGGAVQTGLRYARDRRFDIALQVDGDGQHPASEIDKIIAPILDSKADVVIGSRFLGEGKFKSSFSRRIGIRIISLFNSILTGRKITDNTSGFRAYNKAAIAFLADYYPQDYPEPVAIIDLFKNGFRIIEVPVVMREREAGISSIGAFGSMYYMIKVVVANLIAFTRKSISREK